MNQVEYNAVDIFCGAGGMSAGLIKAGFNICLAIDNFDIAVNSYRTNFTTIPQGNIICNSVENITTSQIKNHISGKQIDVIFGAPPIEDIGLYIELVRWIESINPTYFMIENGIQFEDKIKEIFKTISNDFIIKTILLDAQDFGINQNRKRFYLIGSKNEKNTEQKLRGVIDGIVKHKCSLKNGTNTYCDLKNKDISIMEAIKIQTFPNDFTFSGSKNQQLDQIINAVPPQLSYIIGKAFIEELRRFRN